MGDADLRIDYRLPHRGQARVDLRTTNTEPARYLAHDLLERLDHQGARDIKVTIMRNPHGLEGC